MKHNAKSIRAFIGAINFEESRLFYQEFGFEESIQQTCQLKNKIMIAKYLWETGSIIIAMLGGLHLYYTFFTNKFSSRNEKVVEEMRTSFPNLTKKTTMWKSWIGFNGSHSSGAIFIGIINFYLASQYFTVLQSDHFFFLFNILTIAFYVFLAKKYWFNIPLTGIVMVLVCFTISYILTLIKFT